MALKQQAHQLRFPSFPSSSLGTRGKNNEGQKSSLSLPSPPLNPLPPGEGKAPSPSSIYPTAIQNATAYIFAAG
jgi:hypothetical protein